MAGWVMYILNYLLSKTKLINDFLLIVSGHVLYPLVIYKDYAGTIPN